MRPSILLAIFPALLVACGHNPPAAAPAPARPAAPETSPATPPPIADTFENDFRTCVIRDGQLALVPITYRAATGDTLVGGRRFSEVYPDTAFAGSKAWFTTSGPITYREKRFVKYGLPRPLSAGDVVPVGEFQGVHVYAEPNASWLEVIYIPVDARCSFQPYIIVGIK